MLEPGKPTTSSFCGTQACVEVIDLTHAVQVRDTKDGGGTTAFTRAAWGLFVAAVKGGLLDA
jgi:hypothetical protein